MIIKSKTGVICTGRLTKDPDKKVINKGDKNWQIVNISLACGSFLNEENKPETVFINAYCWGGKLRDLKKGDNVLIAGPEEIKDYTAKDGSKKIDRKIAVEFLIKEPPYLHEVEMTSSQKEDSENAQKIDDATNDDDFGNLPF